ncbi:hypothetical protein RND71_009495 [Anisodus tanguticus]|uniref:Transmembrane protein n=1 Tax=Anisodus tanguticus TaxID=243964 RepID=A0AAE1SHD2_9SOLA|nr:hypothetical protein RND71_009495 [Anisodus tanguticus]
MSHSSSVSSGSRMKCHYGISAWIFMAYTPVNDGRSFYEAVDLIHILKKNDCLRREKKSLKMRMNDLERYLAFDIEEKCERQDEISVSKGEDVVVDNEEAAVENLKEKVLKMWILIAISCCCFAAFITSWVTK